MDHKDKMQKAMNALLTLLDDAQKRKVYLEQDPENNTVTNLKNITQLIKDIEARITSLKSLQ